MARWSDAEYLKEKYPNGEYVQLSRENEIHKKIGACIAKVKEKAENNRLLSLDGVVECDQGSHYIAFVSGGANGSGDWVEYLGTFQAIIEGLKEDGNAWLVELTNDCCDDVHYALIGFKNVPSSIPVKMTFKSTDDGKDDTVREFSAKQTDDVVKLVKCFCRNLWPTCDKVVIERQK